MDIKSTARERLKAYLDGLSEKQRRGILVAMLAFTCVASGIVLLRAAGRLTPARERMELPFGEGSLTDTLRRLPDPLKGQVTTLHSVRGCAFSSEAGVALLLDSHISDY